MRYTHLFVNLDVSCTICLSCIEIMNEIRSVFEKPMKSNSNFSFKILQPTGGNCKGLSISTLSL